MTAKKTPRPAAKPQTMTKPAQPGGTHGYVPPKPRPKPSSPQGKK